MKQIFEEHPDGTFVLKFDAEEDDRLIAASKWKIIHPRANINTLGWIPMFINENDLRPAREQLNQNYSHGGGWRPFEGFNIVPNGIKYQGDPTTLPLLAEITLRDETIRLYGHAWVMILQKDGSFEISRMD